MRAGLVSVVGPPLSHAVRKHALPMRVPVRDSERAGEPAADGEGKHAVCEYSYDGPFESVLLDGCVDDCRSFETLPEAEAHCNTLGASCGGITKSGEHAARARTHSPSARGACVRQHAVQLRRGAGVGFL